MSDSIRGAVEMVRGRRVVLAAAVAAATTLAVGTPLMAQSQTWVGPAAGGAGSYLEPLHWDPSGTPTATTDAEIANAGTATITGSGAALANRPVLGRAPGQSGTLSIDGGSLSLSELRVGGFATDIANTGGTGTVVQTGGVVTLNASATNHGLYVGDGKVAEGNTAVGSYSISGGELHVGVAGGITGGFLIVGTGKGTVATFTQSNGTVVDAINYTQVARSGANATYNMNGGSFVAGTELNVGDGQGDATGNAGLTRGTFVQTAGAVSSRGVVVVGRRGGNGTYSLTNDTALTADGSFNVGGFASDGIGGVGTFTQDHTSVVTAKQNLYVGATTAGTASGTYTLNSGTINAGSASGNRIVIGDGVGASGTFTQGGGTVNVAGLLQVGGGGGNGSYTMNAGQIVANASAANTGLWVGGGPSQTAGTGTFTMSGDVATVTATFGGDIHVGRGATAGNTARGTLNLNGGTLKTNRSSAIGFFVGGGAGAIGVVNQNGGNVNVAIASSGIEVGTGNGSGTYNLISGDLKTPILRNATGTGTKSIHLSGGTSQVTTLGAGNGSIEVSNGVHTFTNVATNTGTVFLNNHSPTFTNSLTLNSNSTLRAAGTVNVSTVNPIVLATSGASAGFPTNGIILGTATAHVDDGGHLTWSGTVSRAGAGTFFKAGPGTFTISGPQSYGPGVSYTVNSGTFNLNSNGGSNLTIHANSTTNFGATQRLAAVNVGPNAVATVLDDGSAKRVLNANAVTINATGRLDLSNNKLVTNTPIGTFTGGAYTGVQGDVARAYNFGAWDLPGLTTSQELAGPNAGPLSNTTTIGVATGEQILFLAPSDTGVFAGQTVTGATTIAMYTYAGDANFDGLVDGADYGVIDNSVQFPGTDGYANGDFNYDGVIDGADYGVIDNTIQVQGAPIPVNPAPSAAGLSGVTAVPEPASLSVIGCAAAALLGRRRRNAR